MEEYKNLNLILNEQKLEVENYNFEKIAKIEETEIIKTSGFDNTLKSYRIKESFYNLDDDSMNFVLEEVKRNVW